MIAIHPSSSGEPELLWEMPEPPKIGDMRRSHFLYKSGIFSILGQQFAHRPDVLVAGHGYLCHDTANPDAWLVMEIVVAFGVNPDSILERNGYVISDVGKPPDFVLEVSAPDFIMEDIPTEGRGDFARNRDRFAAYGVREYWRADPTGGHLNGQPLDGYRLVSGAYEPVPLTTSPKGVAWGHSQELGLDLCWDWDDSLLRFRDPQGTIGGYLPDYGELRKMRDAAIERRAVAETQRAEADAEVRRLRGEVHLLRRRIGEGPLQ